jgi:hypothetical protein
MLGIFQLAPGPMAKAGWSSELGSRAGFRKAVFVASSHSTSQSTIISCPYGNNSKWQLTWLPLHTSPLSMKGRQSYSPLTRTEPRISCPVTWTMRSFGTQSDQDTMHPSSTWGSQDSPLAISCNSQALNDGKNLFATLRHLRRESEDSSGLTLSVSINTTIKRKRNRCSSCSRSTWT